jgi:hypothetical protein
MKTNKDGIDFRYFRKIFHINMIWGNQKLSNERAT